MLTYAQRESNFIADTIDDVDDVDCAYSTGSSNAVASLRRGCEGEACGEERSGASGGEVGAAAHRT